MTAERQGTPQCGRPLRPGRYRSRAGERPSQITDRRPCGRQASGAPLVPGEGEHAGRDDHVMLIDTRCRRGCRPHSPAFSRPTTSKRSRAPSGDPARGRCEWVEQRARLRRVGAPHRIAHVDLQQHRVADRSARGHRRDGTARSTCATGRDRRPGAAPRPARLASRSATAKTASTRRPSRSIPSTEPPGSIITCGSDAGIRWRSRSSRRGEADVAALTPRDEVDEEADAGAGVRSGTASVARCG